MDFHIIIPARFHSSRLPGKVLADIGGKPMLQHVYDQAEKSGATSVVIATDHEDVKKVAEKFGATVCMTHEGHSTGTERVAEAVNLLEYEDDDIIIGLQADEPFIAGSVVRQMAQDLADHENVKVTSICQLIDNVDDLFNPHITKVILNWRGYAVYFSRAPIPWERDEFTLGGERPKKLRGKHYRHIGIYAYRAGFLPQYCEMEPSDAEQMESLEQLRILWNGGRIHMTVVKEAIPSGIDTEDDLIRARQFYAEERGG